MMDTRNKTGSFFFRKEYGELEHPEQSAWSVIWRVVKENWVRMIGLNVLYVLCCLPVVTIPAATAAMHRVLLNWVRDRHQSLWSAFFTEFRDHFLAKTGVGLLLLLVPVSLPLYPLMLQSRGGAVAVFVLTAILYFCVSSYFYPLVVLLDVPVWSNLKNAFAMAVAERQTTLLMLLTAGVIDALLFLLTAYAAPLFVLFLFAFNSLLCCAFFHAPFRKYFETQPDGASKEV